ncbi:MAG TPA: MBL fold metallo-hydrolase [Firmicutes bacterium]|nr:MBL fold metallo-hydrolase [Bacillota bacterium]
MLEIRSLAHSGFAVFTERTCCIFDYYRDSPAGGSFDDGVIDPAALAAWSAEAAGREIFVFVSHHHRDHWNPVVFTWRQVCPSIHYVLSYDVWTKEEAVRMKPGQTRNVGGAWVRALKSTDVGVAFLVRVDGRALYHAGDLNWWHWEGEPEEENRRMERKYKAQVALLKGEKVDLAFLPADPRQGEDGLRGLLFFLEAVRPRIAVPMHCWEDAEWFERLRTDPALAPWRDRLRILNRRGSRWAE